LKPIYINGEQSLSYVCEERCFDQKNFSVDVPLTGLFKLAILSGSNPEDIEEELESEINPHLLILQAITRYVKRNFEIGELDRETMLYSPSPANLKRSRVKVDMTYGNLSMLDREAKGMSKIMTAIYKKPTSSLPRKPLEEERDELRTAGS